MYILHNIHSHSFWILDVFLFSEKLMNYVLYSCYKVYLHTFLVVHTHNTQIEQIEKLSIDVEEDLAKHMFTIVLETNKIYLCMHVENIHLRFSHVLIFLMLCAY